MPCRTLRVATLPALVTLAVACGGSTADRPAATDTSHAVAGPATGDTAGVAARGPGDTLWLLASTPAGDAIHAADGEATLVARFGRANVTRDSLPGAEGESVYGTVLFAGDSSRTLYVYWKDDTFRGVESVRTAPGATAWVAWPGIAPGDRLADVEGRNGRPFTLYGFGWDYGGLVVDWAGGRFAPLKADSIGFTAVRFRAGQDVAGASGEDTFSSASAPVRASDARVAELIVQAR